MKISKSKRQKQLSDYIKITAEIKLIYPSTHTPVTHLASLHNTAELPYDKNYNFMLLDIVHDNALVIDTLTPPSVIEEWLSLATGRVELAKLTAGRPTAGSFFSATFNVRACRVKYTDIPRSRNELDNIVARFPFLQKYSLNGRKI